MNLVYTIENTFDNGYPCVQTSTVFATDNLEVAKELSSELGWNFLAEYRGYEEQCLTKEGEQHLLKLGIISESDILASKEEWYGDTYAIENSDEFVDIFFKLVKIKIPDLVWDYRDLNEESIHLLDGAGYGLFSN